ncbi:MULTISPECIES: dihydropteroate synthase [unclassified Aureimonas]|uniref:dihydropteroate synthase n=1 Tax=unclassified Aureimonas TaxID=2615206 RepID=UPI0006FF2BB9|nr:MULTISPECIES: dihydropteroate synthase [unclassified Aureimonas]KQT57410.1 dihydropteroate synthase [Aureimonas sp. Leaf427]KQT77089.1 dihydropteroate synthase [Aureimonas sp. Leaf460]
MTPISPLGGRLRLAHGRHLELGRRATIMGILNVTPDSFSDGGRHESVDSAVEAALAMVAEGADIIDIGGESTRPGATPVDPAEEQRRVLPVIEALAGRPDVLLSIDTYRSETARLAVAAGAHLVNDVFGAQKDAGIARVAAETGAGLCLMHTGREREPLADEIEDQILFLTRSLEIASEAGVSREQIVLDPGFGFAKDGPLNMRLMARFEEIRPLGYPVLVGTSRKRFVRGLLGRDDPEPDVATAATSVLLRERGADIFRVHNVRANRDALAIADAMSAAMAGEVW